MDKPTTDKEALEPFIVTPRQICLKIDEYLHKQWEERQIHAVNLKNLTEDIYKIIGDCFGVKTTIKK